MPRRPKEEISVDKEQFYPTPKKLATQLIQMLKEPCGGLILEPSAGTGALLDTFRELQRFHTYSYHCIEPDKTRRATLQGKDYTVVWDDFLTFDPVTPYSLILMNNPSKKDDSNWSHHSSVCCASLYHIRRAYCFHLTRLSFPPISNIDKKHCI